MAIQFVEVPAPPLLPSTVGLLPTLGQRVTVGDGRWIGGYTFGPLGCLDGGVGSTRCDYEATKTIGSFATAVQHVPNFVYVGGQCSSLGGLPRDQIGPRVRSALEGMQGRRIEAELWTGSQATGDSAVNLFLAGGSPNFEDLSPGPSDVSPGGYALAALQEFLAGCGEGGRGMIHASRSTVDIWANASLVRREGNLILDLFDNWIVAGEGYDGSDPDGNVDATGETAYAYATGLVDVRLGSIQMLPEVDEIEAALNRSNNSLVWIAERAFGATWDGCCHAGIRVGLCETCCATSGS